ncbi:hypothetical protein [Polaromonas aquatica]|uniref:Uncharacterized protein n=1 Tax=Polaromonas aquatica TaxID=332657 RepID=A0ABW1TWU8_9BURK
MKPPPPLNDFAHNPDWQGAICSLWPRCQSGVWNGAGLGYGQVLTNVTSIRAFGVPFKNLSGRPIQVDVVAQVGGTPAYGHAFLTVDGVLASMTSNGMGDYDYYGSVSGIVPAGGTYIVGTAGPVTLLSWAEMR